MNIPIVASPVGDYTRMDVRGVLLAKTTDEWESKLEFALEPSNYKEISDGLRERILEFSDIDHFAHKFIGFVES